MANTFKNKVYDGTSSTSASAEMLVYTVPTSTTTVVIGLTLANTNTSSQVTASVKLHAAQSVFLARDIPIPANSSFEFMAGNKIIMEAGHTLAVICNTANSLDTVASIMEIT